jgi:hypothetical protein
MRADTSFVVSGVPPGAYCRGLSQAGEHYALYHHHSELEKSQMSYVVKPGHYYEMLVVDLPGGTYQADWVDPASNRVISSVTFTHQGGNKDLDTPEHTIDIPLRIKRLHRVPKGGRAGQQMPVLWLDPSFCSLRIFLLTKPTR